MSYHEILERIRKRAEDSRARGPDDKTEPMTWGEVYRIFGDTMPFEAAMTLGMLHTDSMRPDDLRAELIRQRDERAKS